MPTDLFVISTVSKKNLKILLLIKKTSSGLFSVSKTHVQSRVFLLSFQELSPTSDTNLIRSLMNLMDCMMDEFTDETKFKAMNDHDIFSWLEVGSMINRQNREQLIRL